MSDCDKDSQEISRIQFHTNLTREEKNREIAKIEKKMYELEQLELDDVWTGYYGKCREESK